MGTLPAYDDWKTRAPDFDYADEHDGEAEPEPTDAPLFTTGPVSVFLLDDGRHLVSVEARHPQADLFAVPSLYEEIEVATYDEAELAAYCMADLAVSWTYLRGPALWSAVARYHRWHEAEDVAKLATAAGDVKWRQFVETGIRLGRESAERAERLAELPASTTRECSICRGVHGMEVVHAAE